MKRIVTLKTAGFVLFILSCLCIQSCEKVVTDEPENVQLMTLKTDDVQEGDDVPVTITFNKAGLTVDNDGWGNPWKNAIFHATVEDSYGHVIDNAVWQGPNGVLVSGSVVDMPENGVLNLALGGLRKGEYLMSVNLETRYTVDTWASANVHIREASIPSNIIKVEDFTVPSKDDGAEFDEAGNLVLDLRVFNEKRPFVYESVLSPMDATVKIINATSNNTTVLSVNVESGRVLVLVPKAIGNAVVQCESADGNVKKTFNVKVIKTEPDAEGFTLPTDDTVNGGDAAAEFDAGGRLALDINDYPQGTYYEFTCLPIPRNATPPTLNASSDAPEIADAKIVNGNTLHVYPKNVGYANITIAKSDNSFKRILRVAIISRGSIILTVEEGSASELDKQSGVFPCTIHFSSTTDYVPPTMAFDAYTKAVFRADLTDPADYFVSEDLKNSRTAYTETSESIYIGFIQGVTKYDVYERLMLKVAGTKYLVHHSADWPNYRDYYLYVKLYKLVFDFRIRKSYDTNLYRFDVINKYDSPENRIYMYL